MPPAQAGPAPDPSAPTAPVPRYAPDVPLPKRAFLPGAGLPRPQAPSHLATDSALALRVGADLFNHGFWWEAHEAWETPWRALRRTQQAAPALLLRGCIMLAAGHLKACAAQPRGRARLYGRALTQWQAAEAAIRHSPDSPWPDWLALSPAPLLARHGPWLRARIAQPEASEREALLTRMPHLQLNR